MAVGTVWVGLYWRKDAVPMAGPIFRHQKRKIEGKKARDDALSALFYLRRSRQIRERKVLFLLFLFLFLLLDLGGLFPDLPCTVHSK